ncbi:MAG: sugar phosphate isomerase/epimerase [Acidimicrobiia bacterium]
MRYGFNTFNHSVWLGLPPTLPAQIHAAAAAGYEHVGLDVPSLLAHEAAGLSPAAIADRMAEVGISPHELAFLSLSGEPATSARDLDDVIRMVEALRPAQVQGVIMGEVDDRCVEFTTTVVAAVAEHGATVCVEYVAGWPVCSIAPVRELIATVGRRELQVCVDTFHFFHGPDTWADLEGLPLAELGLVQFEDALPLADGTDLGTDAVVHGRALPGEGHLDLDGFARRVVGMGYDGVVSVEACSGVWRDRPLDEFARASLATTRAIWERAGSRVEGDEAHGGYG